MVNILFWGEVYPDAIHGISIENKLNLDQLKSSFFVDIIQERTDIRWVGYRGILKFRSLFISFSKILTTLRNKEFDYFYLVLSLSSMGVIKTLIAINFFLFNNKGKVVLHLHRGDVEKFYNSGLIRRFLFRLCFSKVARVVVLSVKQVPFFKSLFKNKKIFVLENSVYDEVPLKFMLGKKIFRKEYIFISNYFREKGIYDLISAFHHLEDSKVRCFGNFCNNEDELKMYQNSRIRINSCIIGLDKLEQLRVSDALILPSFNEGQPIIILESMMMGTPILTARVGLITDLLGDDYPFYFEPNNYLSLVDCVNRFEKFQYKDKLSISLRERYFKFYSQMVHKKKLLKIFS